MRRLSTLALVLIAGCGSIEYGDEPQEQVIVTSGGWDAPDDQAYVYAPAPAPVPAPPTVGVMQDDRRIYCSGNQRIRIGDVVLDGGEGPAVVASGNCVVEISESILRGHPAILAQGNARLAIRECRIQGDVVTHGNARLDTPGSRLEGGRHIAN